MEFEEDQEDPVAKFVSYIKKIVTVLGIILYIFSVYLHMNSDHLLLVFYKRRRFYYEIKIFSEMVRRIYSYIINEA